MKHLVIQQHSKRSKEIIKRNPNVSAAVDRASREGAASTGIPSGSNSGKARVHLVAAVDAGKISSRS